MIGTGWRIGLSNAALQIYDQQWVAGGGRLGNEPVLHAFDATQRYWTAIEPAERINLFGVLDDCLPHLRDGVQLSRFVVADRMDEALAASAGAWRSVPPDIAIGEKERCYVPGTRCKNR